MSQKMSKLVIFITILFIFLQTELHADEFGHRPEFRIPTDPTITLSYGFSDVTLEDFPFRLADAGMLRLRLGFSRIDKLRNHDQIIEVMDRSLSISNISTDIGGNSSSVKVGSNIWRVGMESKNGYGYNLSSASSTPYIVLTHTRGFAWSNVDMEQARFLPPNTLPIDRFEDAIRFGALTGANINLQITNSLGLHAGLERSQIYERFLFWKWGGSILLEGVAHDLLDRFIGEIKSSSPTAAPILHFVLKNGLSYAIYELRRSEMNWPFDTAAPLHHDTFKLGTTFIF